MHRTDKLIYKGDSDSVLRIYHDKGWEREVMGMELLR